MSTRGDMARTEDVATKFTDSSIAGRSWHHRIASREDLQESHGTPYPSLPSKYGNGQSQCQKILPRFDRTGFYPPIQALEPLGPLGHMALWAFTPVGNWFPLFL